MNLANVLCCIFLSITVSVTCGEVDGLQASTQAQKGKEIKKRSVITVEDYPIYLKKRHTNSHKKKSLTKKIVPLKSKYEGSKLKHKPFDVKSDSNTHNKSGYQKPRSAAPAAHQFKKPTKTSRRRAPFKVVPKQKIVFPRYTLPNFDNTGFAEPPPIYEKNKKSRQPAHNQYAPWFKYSTQDNHLISKSGAYIDINEDKVHKTNMYKPKYFTDNSKIIKQYSKAHKNSEHKVLVGGKYAEPPARYAPLSLYQRKEPLQGFVKSINVSPYVNYKHSNMAFSPQNLNDAFSVKK